MFIGVMNHVLGEGGSCMNVMWRDDSYCSDITRDDRDSSTG
jgi:hypothetical protein